MDARNTAALMLTLPSDREIVMTRVFNAPRRLVFTAWTTPEHVKRWYGCKTHALTACEIDLRVGGRYRYVLRGPDGGDLTIAGVYRQIAPTERLIYTERAVSQGAPSAEAIVTVIFAEFAGMTTLTVTVLHQSRENRDAHLKSGVEAGAAETLDRLAALLATMA
jgi:uncharacterized protein YndB with AHSA1/START domain